MNENVNWLGVNWGRRAFYFSLLVSLLAVAAIISGCKSTKASEEVDSGFSGKTPEQIGKYIVQIGGCNDCHTEGFMEADGKVPESQWLTGSAVGFNGPWGTTYPPNLRLTMERMTEDEFVKMAKTRNTLPPMPWPSLHNMDERDLRNVYKYIKSLEPNGLPAPEYLKPGVEPQTLYLDFTPKNLDKLVTK